MHSLCYNVGMAKAGRPPSLKKAVRVSISLRPDVFDKLEQFVQESGLDRSAVISLLIQRTSIESVAAEPKKPSAD